jgi:hypothetical protein
MQTIYSRPYSCPEHPPYMDTIYRQRGDDLLPATGRKNGGILFLYESFKMTVI